MPPCTGPYPNYEVSVFDGSGTTVIDMVATYADGSYSFVLLPGNYTLFSRSTSVSMQAVGTPTSITLNAGDQFTLDLNIDSGAR